MLLRPQLSLVERCDMVVANSHWMRRYDLSQHAKDVIAERHIRIAWLEQVLESPKLVEPDSDDPALMHNLGRIEEHGNRVVFNGSTSPLRIVTVYFDRRMKGKL